MTGAPVAADYAVICGEIRGTECGAPVYPPAFVHEGCLHSGSQAVAEQSRLSPRKLHWMARHRELEVRQMAARHLRTLPSDLELLAQDTDPVVALFAVANPHCPPEALAEVVQCGRDADLLHRAISHPNCPSSVVVQAARHGDLRWRTAAASNPRCPPVAIRHLAAHEQEPRVLAAVAGNRACPPAGFERLAIHPESSVRIAVAANPNCHRSLHVELATDRTTWVSEAMVNNPSCGARALAAARDTHPSAAMALRIAQHPRCPVEMLLEFARDASASVRDAALANPAFPEEYRVLMPINHGGGR